MLKQQFTTQSVAETQSLGERLSGVLQGKIVLLAGDLGVGKTTFVRGVVQGLGLSDRVVSPTFTYQRRYGKGKKAVYHFDLYRVNEDQGDALLEEELMTLIAQGETTIIIEWPEKLSNYLTNTSMNEAVRVGFSFGSGDARIITVNS